jgi:hypothetical protein
MRFVIILYYSDFSGGFIDEAVCGRPLGLKFDKKGNLFVADAYYGIFQVDVNKSKSLFSWTNFSSFVKFWSLEVPVILLKN